MVLVNTACGIDHFLQLLSLVVYECIFAMTMLALLRVCANPNNCNTTLPEPKIKQKEKIQSMQLHMAKSGNINQIPTLSPYVFYFLNQTFSTLCPDPKYT